MNRFKKIHRWKLGALLILSTMCAALAAPAVVTQTSAAEASAKIREVKVKSDHGGVELFIQADKPVEYKTLQMSDPQQALILDISGAVLWGKKETLPVNTDGIKDIRVAQFSSSPDIVRAVLDLEHPIKFTVTSSADRAQLVLACREDGTVSSGPASAPISSQTGAPAAVTQAPASAPEWKDVRITTRTVAPSNMSGAAVLVPYHPNLKPSKVPASLQAKLTRIFAANAKKKKKVYVRRPMAEEPSQYVSFSWKGADLVDVVRSLGDRMGLNVLIDSSVKGNVTLDLKNVSAGQALAMILSINGYAYRQIGNILVVGPPEKLDKMPSVPVAVGPQAIQVIPLAHSKPGDLRDTIVGEYPDLKVDADTRTNSLIVRGSINSIRKAKQLVAELDKPIVVPEAIAPQKEVIQLNYANIKDVMTQIKPLLPSDAILIADERLNSLIVIGSEYAIDTVRSFVSAVDVPSPQVVLEMQVISVDVTNTRDLGMEWPGSVTTNVAETNNGEPGGSLNPAGSTPATPITPNSLSLTNFGIHTLVRDNIGFEAIMHFLIQQNKAKVLGAPRVATLNNKEANIQLGSRIPIVYFDPRAGLYQAQYIDVGVILKVTPTIAPNGDITVHVNPQVSQVTGFVQNFPQLSTRQADTTVRVKNGETIVLGGLLEDQTTDAVTKIPLLGDIPILGEFFRHRATTHIKDDLIISITPTLLANK